MSGFTLYGKEHILWLAICIFAVPVLNAVDRRLNDRARVSLSRLLAVCALLFHLLESAFRIREGSYGIDTLPLHICSISSYLVFIQMLFPNTAIGELVFCPGIAGSACALLFPDWTGYAAFSFISTVSFLSHLFIILYALQALWTGRITPSVKRVRIPVLYLAAYAAIMIPFDRHFEVNYGFLNYPSPGSVLEPLADLFGRGAGYYTGYSLLVLAGIALSYLLHSLLRRTHIGAR